MAWYLASWVRCVHIFLENTTSTNKNRYVLGWSIELIQHQLMDLMRISFLITGHKKFDPDRVFASIGSSYNHCDVFNIDELVSVASRFSTAVKETGVNVLHWRQKLDKKYRDLSGIRKYHDFHVTRNSNGNSQLQVREDCASGELHMSRLTVRRNITTQVQCFPEASLNYLASKRDISREKMSDMYTMYSRFIDQARWPDCMYISQPEPNSCTRPERSISERPMVQAASAQRRGKHCSTPGCDGSGHKDVARWSEGHKTRAGCPIYHNISAPY